jgi:Ser/Thr protein kinase RdoA (MazF antagonist)
VQEFDSLTRRGQLGRLRRLGHRALARFDIHDARLTSLSFAENATFRVRAGGGVYMLRISRPGVHAPSTVASEMAWLAALRRDMDLGLPEPVPSSDGALVVSVGEPGVPEERICVLLRWLDGRRVDGGLAPVHLARVGTVLARLHAHAESWAPPPGFARPRVATLTDAAKAEAFPSADAARRGEHPSRDDGERAVELVARFVSPGDAVVVSRALDHVRATTRELLRTDSFGLVHGDLHPWNVLFRGSEALAIDFDDCGWSFHLYDLQVALSELRSRPGYDALRTAFLEAYATERPVPVGFDAHLARLFLLRSIQILTWILESRDRPPFRCGWRTWAREELDLITSELPSLEP